MRNTILFTAFFLSLVAVLITWQMPNSDDEFAYRMSKSESFKVIMNFWKMNSDKITKMPDSNKIKLRALKPRIDFLLQKNIYLNPSKIKDSLIQMTKFVKANSLIDSSFLKASATMAPVYKRFYDEFPELKKMPREKRSKVFKKATALLRNASKA